MFKRKQPEYKGPNPKKPKVSEIITEFEDHCPLKVFCRIRPTSDQCASIYEIQDCQHLKINPPPQSSVQNIQNFEFTRVFRPEATQQETCEVVAEPILNDFLQSSKSALLFAYGITSAGKTHTILGTQDSPGVIPWVLSKLSLTYKIQFFEIYNDHIYDLLQPSKTPKNPLKIRQDNNSVKILGITEQVVTNFEEAMEVLKFGQNNRRLAETMLNQSSSRSHCVFVILHEGKKLAMVDLAGAERNARTNTAGERLKEAAHINNSLSVLGRCLEAIKNNQSKSKKDIIPFRDTLLTKIFCEFFTGDKNIALVININPRKADFEETIGALKFAAITTGLKPVKSKIQKDKKSDSLKLQELEALLKDKEEEINNLRLENETKSEVTTASSDSGKIDPEVEAEIRKKTVQEVKEIMQDFEKMYKDNRELLIEYYEDILNKKSEIWSSRLASALAKKDTSQKSLETSTLQICNFRENQSEKAQQTDIPFVALEEYQKLKSENESLRATVKALQKAIDTIDNLKSVNEEEEILQNSSKKEKRRKSEKQRKRKSSTSSPVAHRTRKALKSKSDN